MERITLFVADDHPVYRDGIVRAIKDRPELELVGEAATGREAIEGIARLRPTVALLDVSMPDLSGPDVLKALQRDGIPTRCVVLSAHTQSDIVYRCVAAGAVGYLSKDSSREEICDALVAAARGTTVLSPEIQTGLAAEVRLRETDERPTLTGREREVLHLIAEGHSAPDIGRMLHLSTATVKTHLQGVYEKLEVSDRAAAVAAAMRRGLLE